MATIEINGEKIDPGTTDDLDRIFEDDGIFGVAVHQDDLQFVQVTITGSSALILYVDNKKGISKIPKDRPGREGALQILKTYLEEGSLDSDYTWNDAGLAVASTSGGCFNSVALLAVGYTVLMGFVVTVVL